MSTNGSHYNEEFKADAVKLVLEDGYNMAEAARNLGMAKRTLRDWVKKSQQRFMREQVKEGELEEVKKLREEVRRLRMERDILKKAAAFFAKDRRFIQTTDSRHDYPIAPHLLERQFNPPEANQAWAGDIT